MRSPSGKQAVEREEKGEERERPESTRARHKAKQSVDRSCGREIGRQITREAVWPRQLTEPWSVRTCSTTEMAVWGWREVRMHSSQQLVSRCS